MLILLNNVWHSAVVDLGCVSSRILLIKFKFSKVKVCLVVEYGPNEGYGEERERFWSDMDRTLDNVESGYSFKQKGDCVWVTHILSTEVCISIQEWQGTKTEWKLRA